MNHPNTGVIAGVTSWTGGHDRDDPKLAAPEDSTFRVIGRTLARPLSAEELKIVSGGTGVVELMCASRTDRNDYSPGVF